MEMLLYILLSVAHLMIVLFLVLSHVTRLRLVWMGEVAMVAACAIVYLLVAHHHG